MVAYTYSRVSALNFNTTPPSVAKSATGAVYALTDTTFTTPLNVTMVVGGAVTTALSSDANGFFPDFTVEGRTSVVWKQNASTFTTVLTTTDPVPGAQGIPGTPGTPGVKGDRGDLATWLTNTFYPLNQIIANPSGDLVKVTTAHTSGATYDGTKFGWVNNNAANLTGTLPEASVPTRLTATELALTYATLDGQGRQPVRKGELFVNVKDHGAVGNGTTDDTASILAAANAAASAGATLLLARKRYRVTSLTFPANLTVRTNGCTFVKAENNATYALITESGFTADALDLELAGGAANDAGIFINGSNTAIGNVKVVSLTADQPGANALLVGDLTATKSNIRINAITLTGFRSPMRVINVNNSRLSNATITNFMTGVYIINCKDSTFDKFNVTGTSPASTGGAGQNGFLLEAQNVDYGCINLRFRDWVIDGAPEHSYRIGGSLTVADVTFDNCISRNPGNAPGNVATGGAAFKVLGAAANMHKNIRFINPTAEDGNVSASGINNHAQYHFGMVDGLTVINPTMRARNKTYSGQIGILLFASKNVEIVAPNIKDTNRQSLYLFKDGTEPSPPIGLTNIRVVGGLLDTLNVNNVIALDTQSAVIKDVFIDGVVISRGSSGLRVETPTTVGADVGAYTNVNVKVGYINAPTGSTTAPITGGNLTVNDYTGPIYGSSIIPSLDGGTYLNISDGKRFIRKIGAWTQQ